METQAPDSSTEQDWRLKAELDAVDTRSALDHVLGRVHGPDVAKEVGAAVGHDVVIGRHSTLSPGVHISGNVTIEPYTFIGTGAVTVNGLSDKPLVLGEGSIIGAGAVVTKRVPAAVTVTGVPARPLANRQTES